MSGQDKDEESPASQPETGGEEAPKEEVKPPWLVGPVAPEWRDEDDDELVKSLRCTHEGAVLSARSFAGDLTLVIRRDAIAEVAISLKDEHGFGYMVDVAGADYPDREERFEVVYHVYNQATERRVRMKVSVAEDSEVPTVSSVWCGANWPEREAYDMYGIRFAGHPDLTRILLWEGFNGYPLRKEFPVEGIDTGAAIYPEYYDQVQGPIAGDGTGWKIPEPPVEQVEEAGAVVAAEPQADAGRAGVAKSESSEEGP